jgi:hypothetical protein
MSISPITYLATPEQQHLLFLALPIKQSLKKNSPSTSHVEATVSTFATMFSGRHPDGSNVFDPRPATGVHFFMAYAQLAGVPDSTGDWKPAPPPKYPCPPPFQLFQVPPPNPETGDLRHLVVVMAIYDADFGPYIGAFTNDQTFAGKLDAGVLEVLDETAFVHPDDPTSAANILANNGTYANPDAFVQLLMRYNFSDPTIPAATSPTPMDPTRFFPLFVFGATFPGMSDTKILKASGGYPNANQLWPLAAGEIKFAPSVPPPPPPPLFDPCSKKGGGN